MTLPRNRFLVKSAWTQNQFCLHCFLFCAYLSEKITQTYAQKTIRNQLTVVRQIFLFALMQRYIRSLPTDGVRIPSGLPKHERVLPVESAVEAVKNTEPNEVILPALILYTGARCGEALLFL